MGSNVRRCCNRRTFCGENGCWDAAAQAIIGDFVMWCPLRSAVTALAEQGHDIFLYVRAQLLLRAARLCLLPLWSRAVKAARRHVRISCTGRR
eukprot:SAG11_NODE_4058_length_2084_cov_1.175819_1_plen_93_part_00